MSILLTEGLPDHHPFSLNLAVSLAVLEGIESALPRVATRGLEVKWPNDIMLKGRKAGGILIENSWRGSRWASAVIGVGLNVFGTAPYPNATKLLATNEDANALPRLQSAILRRLDNRLSELNSPKALLRQYHERLLGWGRRQRWQFDGQEIRGVLEGVDLDGRLCVLGKDGMHCHASGEVGWLGMEPES
jgi:BirA family biotin operon repressor/biotin-[acetyl-CoA-carboxylase] ligase